MKCNLKVIITLVITVCTMLFMVGCMQKPTNANTAAKVESTLLAVIQEQELVVGIVPDFAPWSSLSTGGSFEGYDVDIAKLLGEALGVNVEIMAVDSPNRVASLVSGKVDVIIACMTPTNERAKTVAFSIPYASEGQVLIVKDENADITSYAGMAGEKIALVRGGAPDLYATDVFTDSEILRFDTVADAYIAFKSGKASGFVEQDSYIYTELKKNPGMYKLVGEPFSKGLISMATRQGDEAWLSYLNNFITNMRFNGTNAEIYKKWFGKDAASLVLQ